MIEYNRGGGHIRRQHPITIIHNIGKNFWLLLIPAVRALISYRFDFIRWLDGMFIDMIVLLFLFGHAILKWLLTRYTIEDDHIRVSSGMIVRSFTNIYFSKVSAVTSEKTLIYSLAKCSSVLIDTDARSFFILGGNKTTPDLKLCISDSDCDMLFERFSRNNDEIPMYSDKTNKREAAVFSLFFSSSLSGMILISTLFMNAGRIIDENVQSIISRRILTEAEIISSDLTKKLRLISYVSPAMIILSGLVIMGFAISFMINLSRHLNFRYKATEDGIFIRDGFITKRRYYISKKHINYVDIRQNLLMKLFRVMSVHICCAGYGKTKYEIPVFVPVTRERYISDILGKTLSDFSYEPKVINHIKKRYIMRYLMPPAVLMLALIWGSGVLCILFPDWLDLISLGCVIVYIPLLWLLIVKTAAFCTSGSGKAKHTHYVRYCDMYSFHTVIIPEERIAKTLMSQNIFQYLGRSCDTAIYSNAEYTRKHTVRGQELA